MARWIALVLLAVSLRAGGEVADGSGERRFSIPAARLGVAIPSEDWVIGREQRRPGDTAAYYMLSSERRRVVFSVFIDRTNVCNSADACLDAALKNASYKEARDLQRGQSGAFATATFYLDNPMGAPIKQAHVLASAYLDGVWYDIHISKAERERPDLAPLLETLKSVALK